MESRAAVPGFFARLFRSNAPPRELSLADMGECLPTEDELLWVDLSAPDEQTLDNLWRACELPALVRPLLESGSTPLVERDGEYFWARAVAVAPAQGDELVSGAVLICVAGRNRVITYHTEEIQFLAALREAAHGAVIGSLSSESFVATLLDRQLSGYFDAVSDFECAVEHLESDMSSNDIEANLQELQRLRRWASRLRRMLAPHRAVFGTLSRPDFRPSESRDAERHFVALDTRFERAMDMIENARELVVGSFELFSGQVALRTNGSMRVLTFVTVIAGVLATFVGALGMNFEASLFQTRDAGFWSIVVGLLLFSVAMTLLGRRRRWF
ncbi:CorA family divalent cation transporter [Stenotrophomonas sp.]|uniref:magnesium transporter CorA family protein n=1 Tax=Stenotrophomonas sp. TaxID=69392 RepID=UPI0028B17538|nr:CorA family divalent cation transporter [Stenotrophomonas sp.]